MPQWKTNVPIVQKTPTAFLGIQSQEQWDAWLVLLGWMVIIRVARLVNERVPSRFGDAPFPSRQPRTLIAQKGVMEILWATLMATRTDHDQRLDAERSSTVFQTRGTNDHEPHPSIRITTASHKLGLHSMNRNGRIVLPRSHHQ